MTDNNNSPGLPRRGSTDLSRSPNRRSSSLCDKSPSKNQKFSPTKGSGLNKSSSGESLNKTGMTTVPLDDVMPSEMQTSLYM